MYSVTRDEIAAECKGDSGELYTLGWRDGHWRCSCKARVDCSHLGALWCVVAVARETSLSSSVTPTTSPLRKPKAWLREQLDDGAPCPCCSQHAAGLSLDAVRRCCSSAREDVPAGWDNRVRRDETDQGQGSRVTRHGCACGTAQSRNESAVSTVGSRDGGGLPHKGSSSCWGTRRSRSTSTLRCGGCCATKTRGSRSATHSVRCSTTTRTCAGTASRPSGFDAFWVSLSTFNEGERHARRHHQHRRGWHYRHRGDSQPPPQVGTSGVDTSAPLTYTFPRDAR